MLTHGLTPREVGAGTARPIFGAILDAAARAVNALSCWLWARAYAAAERRYWPKGDA